MPFDLGTLPDIDAVASHLHGEWTMPLRRQGLRFWPGVDGTHLLQAYDCLTSMNKKRYREQVQAVYWAIAASQMHLPSFMWHGDYYGPVVHIARGSSCH